MTKNECIEIIKSSSWQYWTTSPDWNDSEDSLFCNETASYDKELGIALKLQEKDDFDEKWVKIYPDKSATKVSVNILYNGNNILENPLTLVYVDGGRALIPLPRGDKSNPYFDELDKKVGKIFSRDEFYSKFDILENWLKSNEYN